MTNNTPDYEDNLYFEEKKMSKEYQVVVCYTVKELEETVSEYIRCGYKPVGGIVINKGFIAQAVYKE